MYEREFTSVGTRGLLQLNLVFAYFVHALQLRNLLLTGFWGWSYEKEATRRNVAYQVLITIPRKFFYSLIWYYNYILVMILLASPIGKLLLEFHMK